MDTKSSFTRILRTFSVLFLIIGIVSFVEGTTYRNLSLWMFMDAVVFAIAGYYVNHKMGSKEITGSKVELQNNVSGKSQIGLLSNITYCVSVLGLWTVFIFSINRGINLSREMLVLLQSNVGNNFFIDWAMKYTIINTHIGQINLADFIILGFTSLLIVIKSSDYVVGSISNYAKKMGLSDYLIGFLIVSVGTSLPELITAITASLTDVGEGGMLILGNVIGANLIDATLVLGIMAIIGRKIKVKSKMISKTMFLILAIAMLPLMLSIDGTISQVDGGIMLVFFAYYVFSLWKREGKFGQIKKDVAWKHIYKDMIVFVVSLLFLLTSAKFLVMSAINISIALNIEAYIIGLIIIAIGTTTPELTVEIRSILKGHKDIGFGDIMGSVICNSSLVLGIAAITRPITIASTSFGSFINGAAFMITAVFISLLFLNKGEISWREGMGLILVYGTFLISELVPIFV